MSSSSPSTDTERNSRREIHGTPSTLVITMTVRGRRTDLEAFRLAVGQCRIQYDGVGEYTDFSLNSIVPLPTEALNLIQQAQSLIALEALCKDKWGTTDAKGVIMREFDHKLRLTFCLTDDLPIRVFKIMVQRFNHLKFKIEYRNDRCGYCGVAVSRRGQLHIWRHELHAYQKRHSA